MANRQPNMKGLQSHAKSKSETSLKKVDEAVKTLMKEQKTINFCTVAQEADVSTAYLYKQPSLRDRIKQLRAQQEGLPSPKKVKRNMSERSKDVIIAALRGKIKILEGENRELKAKLGSFLGEMYKNS